MIATATTTASQHRALVTTTDAKQNDRDSSPRPTSPYLAQLLTTKEDQPQTRLGNRADAQQAADHYHVQSVARVLPPRHRLLRDL